MFNFYMQNIKKKIRKKKESDGINKKFLYVCQDLINPLMRSFSVGLTA